MLKSMLDKLYSSQNGMMYFYIISASIAFILIILISFVSSVLPIISLSKKKPIDVIYDK